MKFQLRVPSILIFLLLCSVNTASADFIKSYQFPTAAALKQWKEKIFKGRTTYEVKIEGGGGFLNGYTDQYSSALYAEVANWDLEKNPILSWEWRVEKFPPRQPNLAKQSNDYAVRVYVIFPAKFFMNSKAIAYAWDPKAPIGAHYQSSWTKNMKIFVAETGPATMEWRQEKRNVLEDYIKIFGEKPDRPPGAIGILVDSDDDKQLSKANVRYVNAGGSIE